MTSTDKFIWWFFGLICGEIFVVVIVLIADPIGMGYKKGQIDAQTGKVKYHLVTEPDSTRTWQEVK